MSGFAARIFGYFAILDQMSGFADRIFGYFQILQHVYLSCAFFTSFLLIPRRANPSG